MASTPPKDPRVIWEDGTWAIIEAGNYPPGIGRSKTADTPRDAIGATWEPTLVTPPGPQSIKAKKLLKVRLAEFLANAPAIPVKALPKAKDMIAPPSPFMPKPWKTRDIPEFPHHCRVCGGKYYQGLQKTIHEATEHGPLNGACPGPQLKARA